MCLAAQYMRTLRVPMSAFCAEPGFDPSQVRFVRITLPDTPRPSALYVDTIEFTHSPTLDVGAACG